MEKFLSLVFVAMIAFWLQGCATPNGNAKVFRTNQNGELIGAWTQANARDLIGYKEPGISGNDVFSITLDNGFMRYLPDFFNSNEVVIIATFNEGVSDDTEVVKIIGPMERFADDSELSQKSRIIYGPKKIEGQALSVNFKVLEYDQDESDDAVAFTEFLATTAKAINIADPVTQQEINFTKQLAQQLLRLNKDDGVYKVSFDLVPYDQSRWLDKDLAQKINPMPLAPGHVIMIKEEKCGLMRCYYQLTKRVGENISWGNSIPMIMAGIVDTFGALIVLPVRLFSDAPDTQALSSIEMGKGTHVNKVFDMKVCKKPLKYDFQNRFLTNECEDILDSNDAFIQKMYKSKTWLSFSIQKGGDASQWEERKVLSSAADEFLQKIRGKNGATIKSMEDFEKTINTTLDEYKKLKMADDFELLAPTHAFSLAELGAASFIVRHPGNIDRHAALNAQIFQMDEASQLNTVTEIVQAADSANLGNQLSQFDFDDAEMQKITAAGNYQLHVNYTVNGMTKTMMFPLTVTE